MSTFLGMANADTINGLAVAGPNDKIDGLDGDAIAAVLMEPVMRVEVVCPKDYLGDVMGDLASRRGRIQSQEDRGGTQIISARVPLSDMFGYATDLRSRTQGRATYSMFFERYEQAPRNVSEEVIARVQGTK